MRSCNSERYEVDLTAEGASPTKQTIQNKRVIAHLAQINHNLQERVEEKLQEFQKIIPKLPTTAGPGTGSSEALGSPSIGEADACAEPTAQKEVGVERFEVLKYFTRYIQQ